MGLFAQALTVALTPIKAKLDQLLKAQAAQAKEQAAHNTAVQKQLDAILQGEKTLYGNDGVLSKKLDKVLAGLDKIFPEPGPAVQGVIHFQFDEETEMSFVLPDNKTATGVLDLADAKHVHGATLDAPPVYQSSDPAVIVTADANEPLIFHVSVGDGATAGDVQISAQCVAGGNSFVVQGVVTIGAGPAVEGAMNLSVDAP